MAQPAKTAEAPPAPPTPTPSPPKDQNEEPTPTQQGGVSDGTPPGDVKVTEVGDDVPVSNSTAFRELEPTLKEGDTKTAFNTEPVDTDFEKAYDGALHAVVDPFSEEGESPFDSKQGFIGGDPFRNVVSEVRNPAPQS